MNKNIFFSLLILLVLFCVSCKKDSALVVADPFDHEAQIPIDKELLDEYLSSHYYNTNDGLIWTIGSNGGDGIEEPLIDDKNLNSIEGIEYNGTVATYTMYYYTENEGSGSGKEGYSRPSPVDSVFVRYSGMLLDSTVFDAKEDYPIWFQLSNTIQGWGRGVSKFKRGSFKENDSIADDYEFVNPGKGYLFIPSGLGYQNLGSGIIPPNAPLVFRIELDDVKLIDTDLDLVPTKFEMLIDKAGNITTYDTDGDSRDDFEDVDDDNDFTLTKDEVIDQYGSPYSCSDDPSDPNYCENSRVEVEFIFDKDGDVDGVITNPNYKNSEVNLE